MRSQVTIRDLNRSHELERIGEADPSVAITKRFFSKFQDGCHRQQAEFQRDDQQFTIDCVLEQKRHTNEGNNDTDLDRDVAIGKPGEDSDELFHSGDLFCDYGTIE